MSDFAALVLVIGLAAYRVARIVVAEDGPFDMFAKARAALRVDQQDTWVKRGLACVACVPSILSPASAYWSLKEDPPSFIWC